MLTLHFVLPLGWPHRSGTRHAPGRALRDEHVCHVRRYHLLQGEVDGGAEHDTRARRVQRAQEHVVYHCGEAILEKEQEEVKAKWAIVESLVKCAINPYSLQARPGCYLFYRQ